MGNKLRAATAMLSLAASILTFTAGARADDVAPGLLDDAILADATTELAELVSTLPHSERAKITGIYIALAPTREDLVGLPACDDDGDYVVVLSRGFLDLLEDVAFADASDRVRGTELLSSYGPTFARAHLPGARPLPVPPALATSTDALGGAVAEVAHAFVLDALAWVVADEVAPALAGDVVCPAPTVTHEAGDDEWTPSEHQEALAFAQLRMTHQPASDEWATRSVLSRTSPRSIVPARELLRVLAPLEEAHVASTYFALHPGTEARAQALEDIESRVRPRAQLSPPPAISPHARPGMR